MATSNKTTKSAGEEPAAKKTKAAKATAAPAPAEKPAAAEKPTAPVAAGPTQAQLDEAKRATDEAKRASDEAKRAADEAKRAADEAKKRADAAEQKVQTSEKRASDLAGDLERVNAQLQGERTEKERAGARTRELEAQVAGFKLRCPKCGKNLQEELYEGITIDRCTGCNGIYFDAGEVEQLVTKLSQPQRPGFWSGLFGKKAKPPEAGSGGPTRT